ncbi:CAP domain-containing protein [Nonomuraea ceibae]|uniref:CAP domain-containing protein n=1 Tax=Nonomuraea ceibae TaxID=1935170 RepID=UPI001FEB5E6A|nr:CAP domain-containing protein [Nonomuraea ceibae]
MRRSLGMIACLATAATLVTPAAHAASTASTAQAACRLSVTGPQVGDDGRIRASATRSGCERPALIRVRVKRAQPGKDPVVRSGARRATGARLTLTLPCAPGVYYALATDYRGHTARSRPVRLTCSPAPAPAPAPTPSATATPAPAPTASPAPPAGTVGTAEENEVVRLTNAERAKGGCAPLKHDPQLRKAAFGHSSDMAARGYFSHTSQDGRSFMDRIRAAGFTGGTGWAENIAMGQRTPAAVVSGWMNSSGHRANIMNCKYTLIGVGAAKNAKGQTYWTQNFAAR